mmetsp:Transcript_32865/g.28822  ORF Transcript_32865/g.28822 Transcript_32865/m.28822 type:complete len:159 (+) Transcript_32865:101-577(+)
MGASASCSKNKFYGFFKDAFNYDERKELCDKMIKENPKKLPIIVETIPENGLPCTQKVLYMVARNTTILNLSQKLRKKLCLNHKQEENFMFIIMSCIGNASIWRCPRKNEKLWNLYDDNKDSDGFFYIKMGNKEKINWNKLSEHCANYQNDLFSKPKA